MTPPVAEWVEREARRLRRERRESAFDHALLFVALAVGISAVVWFGMELLVGGGL